MMQAFCSKADLELAVGGAAALVQLLDHDRDQVADQDLVDAAITAAMAEVTSTAQIVVLLRTLAPPYPVVLVRITARIAAYYAWLLGSKGQAMPDDVRQDYQEALRWLDRLAEGKRTLGVDPHPASALGVGLVEVNREGDRITRKSMEGFC